MKIDFSTPQSSDRALLQFLFLLVIILYLILGTRFPSPGTDEGYFLLPSVAFADFFEFYTRSLISHSDPLWMPPGYYVLIGSILRIFDFLAISPLVLARFVSLIAVLLSGYCFFRVFQFVKVSNPTSILVLSMTILLPPVFCIANLARMEALFLLLASFSLLQYFRGRFWSWVGVIAFSPLIHPNGLVLVFAALPTLILKVGRRDINPSVIGIICFFAVIVLWVLYVRYVGNNWVEFKSQMDVQLIRKLERSLWSSISAPSNLAAFATWGLWWWRCRMNKEQLFESLMSYEPMLLLGMIMTFVIGMEMWYRSFWCVAVLYLLACLFDSWKDSVQDINVRFFTLVVILVGPILFLNFPWTWASQRILAESKEPRVYDKVCRELNASFKNPADRVLVSANHSEDTVLLLACMPTRDLRKKSGWIPYLPIMGDKPLPNEKSFEISLK